MMKKILSLVIALCLTISLLPAGAAAAIVGSESSVQTSEALQQLAQDRQEGIVTGETAAAVQIENPGVVLQLDPQNQQLETIADDEPVRVIVLMEAQGLLEHVFTAS